MTDTLGLVVDSIIIETVSSIPDEMFNFYDDLPGRNPSEISKRISASMKKIGHQEFIDIFRSAVDSAVFSILYLMENNFKERGIETIFAQDDGGNVAASSGLTDLYRLKVNPGGLLKE